MKALGMTLLKMKWKLWAYLLMLLVFTSGCKFGNGDTKGYVGGPGGGTGSGGQMALVVLKPTSSDLVIPEGSQVEIVLELDRNLPKDSEVSWLIDNGADDFDSKSGTSEIKSGKSQVRIPIKALDDGTYEGDEVFKAKIFGDPSVFSAAVEINLQVQEASPQPVVSFGSSNQMIQEDSGSHTVQVLMSVPSAQVTTVKLETSGTAESNGTDYFLSPSDEVTFLPGETFKEIQIVLVDDAATESLEEAVLELTEVTYGVATVDSSLKAHTLWIVDDDSALSYLITGVTGGADVKVDLFLTSGVEPTVSWQAAPDAASYTVEVREMDGVTPACASSPSITDVTYTFTGCVLTEGQKYKMYVEADILGVPVAASNNSLEFKVDSTPPDDFIVMGVTGGFDISPDKFLAGGLYPAIHWSDAPDEFEYFVTIYEADQTTVKCPQVRVAANQQAYSFSNCQLILETEYIAEVTAKDEAGNSAQATNSPFQFTVTTVPSGFVIFGVTGGTADTDMDGEMTDGVDPVINWDNASGEVSFDVTIYENNESTIKCPTINVAQDSNSVAFPNCELDLHTLYKVVVVAYDSNGNAYPAANSPFQFRHKVGLYISGTGGSYYRGVAITSCGGANLDVCDSTTPYVAQNRLEEPQIRISNTGVIQGRAWTAGAPSVTNGILEIVAQKLWVDPGSTISMTGMGYTPGNGPGAGIFATANFEGGSGGAYGGHSGFTNTASPSPYGSTLNPVDLGSPGGSNTVVNCAGVAEGGRGGGVISVQAETIFLNGTIESNGEPGILRNCNSANRTTSGGGSGGTVRVQAQVLQGSSGSLKANGGNGAAITSGNQSVAGAGSGGRILLSFDDDDFIGTVDTMTLQSWGGTAANTRAGAAGTVVLVDQTQGTSRMIVDNGPNLHLQGIETPVPMGETLDTWETRNNGTLIIESGDVFELFSDTISYRLVAEGDFVLPMAGQDLKIAGGGYLEWRRADTLSLNSLDIQPGGVLTHSYNSNALQYALNVQVNDLTLLGNIDVSERGYAVGQGPGAATVNAGGAYGGMGGRGSSETSPTPYGSVKAPNQLGSGGSGARGGGLVMLDVTNDFLLMGNIFANGASASTGGGGTGGTINISAGRILGTGSLLQVNGGNGASNAGGGSGGRLKLAIADDAYLPAGVLAMQLQAYGGVGSFRDGAAGTVFVWDTDSAQTNGHLIVRNSTRSYAEDTTTTLLAAEDFDSIISDGSGTLHVGPGITLDLPSQTISYRLVMEGDFTLPGSDDLVLAGGGYLEWRKNTSLVLDSLTIESGAVLTHTHNGATADYSVNVSVGDLTLNGEIDASERGYTAGNGTGASANVGGSSDGAAGASYGGRGGWGSFTPGVAAYGDLKDPNDLGSGGGSNSAASGGRGGGLVRLAVSGTFANFGTIRANGQAGSTSGSRGGGGGSGGGIFIDAATVTGIGGLIEAIGGNGPGSAGNGSGGRVAFLYNTDNYTGGVENMVIRASGGTSSHSRSGAAGTIYFRDKSLGGASDGKLIVDNGGLHHQQGVETPVPVGIALDNYSTRNNGTFILAATDPPFELQSDIIDYRIVIEGTHTLPGGSTDLTIASGGMLEWRKNSQITLNSLTINSGGLLTHSYNSSAESYFLDIAVNTLNLYGTINVDNRGYSAGQGPGASSTSAGGSYGGQGGASTSYGQAPATYGDIITPDDLGSGSGSARGGGLVIVTATTANINGMISARGQSLNSCSGGGSGGTIRLEADEIKGATGVFRVNGGSSSSSCGGGGGGGRIALDYDTDNFGAGGLQELTMEAFGGSGAFYGAAGTIYLMHNGTDTLGRLIAKNGPVPRYEWTTTTLPNNGEFDSIATDSGTSLEIKAGETFTLPSATLDYRLVVGGDFVLPGGGQDLVLAPGGYLEIRKNDPLVLNSLTIAAGATLTHSSNFSAANYKLDLQINDLVINGTIDVSSKGFQARSGPGSLLGAWGGAGYGGFGGKGVETHPQGAPYGSVRDPQDLGSGGGAPSVLVAGRGGGLVLIDAGTLTLNGTISANGGSGASFGSGQIVTGGSGGSVNITAGVLKGNTGAIYSRGGNAISSSYGSGSGGRIAVTYNTQTYTGGLSQLIMDARGGTTNDIDMVGAAGTIYIRDDLADWDKLIINNFTNPFRRNVNTALLDNYPYDEYEIGTRSGIYIPTGATIDLWTDVIDFPLEVDGDVNWPADLTLASTGYLDWVRIMDPLVPDPLILNSLTLQSGATITTPDNTGADMEHFIDIVVTGDLVMSPGARIEVSGTGYRAGVGPGAGVNAPSNNSPSGGSYGGEGGEGNNNTVAPAPYGDPNNPFELGSGGSSSGSSAGGGYVRLNIGGNFHFEGEILANGDTISGQVSSARGRGAGSGGGIHITTNSLSGSMGLIEAKGGSTLPEGLPVDTGGSGGGGRVYLSYNSDTYVGPIGSPNGLNISVEPGDSRPDRIGQPGSIVLGP